MRGNHSAHRDQLWIFPCVQYIRAILVKMIEKHETVGGMASINYVSLRVQAVIYV